MQDYPITPSQKAQLLDDGYVSLPGAIPADLLARLRAMADRLEAKALDQHAHGDNQGKAAVFDTADGPVCERIDKLLEWSPDEVLDLLSSPALMAVARELCGEGAVPIEMDLLYKRQHPNGYVIWHQGAQHSRRWPYLNVGVYLDDCRRRGRWLCAICAEDPAYGQTGLICALAGEHGWRTYRDPSTSRPNRATFWCRT